MSQRTGRDGQQTKEPGMAKKKIVVGESSKRGKRVIDPAPTFDVVGWVTEVEAAEIRTKMFGSVVNRTTIARWRGAKYIRSIDINKKLILVSLEDIKTFEGVPAGNPAVLTAKMPDRVDPLPAEMTLKLRKRKQGDEPDKAWGNRWVK